MTSYARGAVIEIIEKRKGAIGDTFADDVIIPNEIRINGQPLLNPADHPIKVHAVELKDEQAVLVTLTLFAKRITVCAEEEEASA